MPSLPSLHESIEYIDIMVLRYNVWRSGSWDFVRSFIPLLPIQLSPT